MHRRTDIEEDLDLALMPVNRIFKMHADTYPDRPMVTCEDRMVTRNEFDHRTNRLARAYAELGVGQDDLVTIALPNGIEFLEAAVATLKLGATPQPVSHKLPRQELESIVQLAKPALIVGATDDIGKNCPHVGPDFVPSNALSDDIHPDRIARCWKAPTSGGSTGRPKLILAGNAAQFDPSADFAGMALGQTQLVPGPFYHNAPFSFALIGLTRGHHLVVMKRFDALESLTLLDQHKPEWVLMVPTMMLRIWRLGADVRNRYDLSSIKFLWHMAAPCPTWLKEEWIKWIGPEKIWELYGGTEGQGTTVINGTEWLEHKGSVGKPNAICQMKILDDEGHELPAGEIGEIYMRPNNGVGTTYTYVGAEAKSTTDGFESLGDLGSFDEDGYLYLADRRTDMILSGGANIYPAEVEAAIDQYPHVRSSAVIGLPDEDLGSRVHAIVDVTEPTTKDELLAFLADQLVRYKLPRTIEFVNDPVRDDAGKVRRKALREERLH